MSTSADTILHETAHRPWPLPDQPWVIEQDWNDLLFLHWPVPVEAIRERVPAALEIETFEDRAWVAVSPFLMSGVRARFTPSIPFLSQFAEVNFRTYVRHGTRPGVWFFSLDCTSQVAVTGARNAYHLPYHLAAIDLANDGASVRCHSRRIEQGMPEAVLSVKYSPSGPGAEAAPGSFEAWAIERYCLYSENAQERSLWRTDIHHRPWVLRPAQVQITENTLASALGIELPGAPSYHHFCARMEVLTWLPVRVGPSDRAG